MLPAARDVSMSSRISVNHLVHMNLARNEPLSVNGADHIYGAAKPVARRLASPSRRHQQIPTFNFCSYEKRKIVSFGLIATSIAHFSSVVDAKQGVSPRFGVYTQQNGRRLATAANGGIDWD